MSFLLSGSAIRKANQGLNKINAFQDFIRVSLLMGSVGRFWLLHSYELSGPRGLNSSREWPSTDNVVEDWAEYAEFGVLLAQSGKNVDRSGVLSDFFGGIWS